VLRIGLTGGIGAGKSEVAAWLADHGAVIIDADQLAREAVAPGTTGLREVVEVFGSAVLGADGRIDRAALADAVFHDGRARKRLESIIHPLVRARTAELAAAAPPDAILVNDVPLLVEVGLAATYHLVVVVETAEPIRVTRLARSRKLPEQQVRARIRAQASDAARRGAADVVLANDGTRADLHAAVEALWRERLVPYEENVRLRRVVRHPDQLHLAPYDPTWPAQYGRLAARLTHAVGTGCLRVDHVGSTAVPGLPAQDVIDIQLTVTDLTVADALADPLTDAGFPRSPDASHATSNERRHGGTDPARVVHLHVRAAGSPGWRLALLLRDWLRTEPAGRAEYLALKQRLAGTGMSTGEYAKAKESWFDAVRRRAEQWAAETAWRP
jgi:dephospho-CoA kinase